MGAALALGKGRPLLLSTTLQEWWPLLYKKIGYTFARVAATPLPKIKLGYPFARVAATPLSEIRILFL